MVKRRTRALIELGLSTLALFTTLYSWKYMWSNVEKWDKPIPASPIEITAGTLKQILFHWAYDHNVSSIRTKRRRGLLAGLLFTGCHIVAQRLARDSEVFEYNYNVGTLIGTVGYRLWYGLLHPLPGEDN